MRKEVLFKWSITAGYSFSSDDSGILWHIVANSCIDIFVIDREINSEAIAAEFEGRGWGLLSMLTATNINLWRLGI